MTKGLNSSACTTAHQTQNYVVYLCRKEGHVFSTLLTNAKTNQRATKPGGKEGRLVHPPRNVPARQFYIPCTTRAATWEKMGRVFMTAGAHSSDNAAAATSTGATQGGHRYQKNANARQGPEKLSVYPDVYRGGSLQLHNSSHRVRQHVYYPNYLFFFLANVAHLRAKPEELPQRRPHGLSRAEPPPPPAVAAAAPVVRKRHQVHRRLGYVAAGVP